MIHNSQKFNTSLQMIQCFINYMVYNNPFTSRSEFHPSAADASSFIFSSLNKPESSQLTPTLVQPKWHCVTFLNTQNFHSFIHICLVFSFRYRHSSSVRTLVHYPAYKAKTHHRKRDITWLRNMDHSPGGARRPNDHDWHAGQGPLPRPEPELHLPHGWKFHRLRVNWMEKSGN